MKKQNEDKGFMAKVSKKGPDLVIIIPRDKQKHYNPRDWVMVVPVTLISNGKKGG